MITRKVMQVNKTLTVSLPKQLCELIGLEKGDAVTCEWKDEKIILTPVPTNRQVQTGTGVATQHGGYV